MTTMTENEYALFNLRNLKVEISKIFNILNNRAIQAAPSEREIFKAAVDRLRLLSRSDDAKGMTEAIVNFQKLEDRALDKEVISQEKHEEQLIDRLTKLRR